MRRLILPLFVLLGAPAAVLPAAAPAQMIRVNYVKNAECTRWKDPVTMYYVGAGASAPRVIADIRRHSGWRWTDPDELFGRKFYQSATYFAGDCRKQAGERASRPAPGFDRYHVRVWQQPRSGLNPFYTSLTPHKEDWVAGRGCGVGSHAVEPGHIDPEHRDDQYYGGNYYSGFDHGRDELLGKIAAGREHHHRSRPELWRNTRSFKQCRSGWRSGAGGTVFRVVQG